MARLYTRSGDAGTTGVLGPERVSKDDTRVEAVGAIDELNAVLGVTMMAVKQKEVRDVLRNVQDELFTVGADLAASGAPKEVKVPRVTMDHVARLESVMEEFDVGTVKEFILPRGSEGLARVHWARTVARRAERRVVALSKTREVNPNVLRYVNRLSSLLYQMAVWMQKRGGRRQDHPTYRR